MVDRIVDPIVPTTMEAFYHLQGEFDQRKTCYDEDYYRLRGIWLDCRGTLQVMRGASLEWGVRILTLSHPSDLFGGGPNVDRPVIIESRTWICSFATLYNCHIGEGAIVALSSVVRSQDVPPWTMVAGNPAQIIARFDHESRKWKYLDEPERPPARRS
jgi:hypothetical protein